MNAGFFADTFYFLALLNADDAAHEAADRFAADEAKSLVTTAWVLTEVADGFAEPPGRLLIPQLIADLEADTRVEIVPAEPTLWRRGLELYEKRSDKGWSLTDCISFVVMKDRGITEALTGDRHFEQAGFRAIFK